MGDAICIESDDDVQKNHENPLIIHREEIANDNLFGRVVSSEQEAYNLYNDYAMRIGFSVRKGKVRYESGKKVIKQREYFCSKEGYAIDENLCADKKFNKLDTRTGCKARIRFTVTDGQWMVTSFTPDHNHDLATEEEKHLLKSQRYISKDKACVIESMVNAGISTKNTYSYIVEEVGGPEYVGFTKRDCYNYVNKQKMIMIEAGDAQSLVNHFKLKAKEDPMFFYTVQVDQENRMTNFFWRDGRSRIDYDCFGDVVVFDTTYRTNKYNLVCAPFIGVNHHWQNVMFGCAFLLDETTSSFIWLFESFLESMGDRPPKTIITDQDQAMSNAIESVFPNTCHRLCLWHISKNAPSHLGGLHAKPQFWHLFNKCLQGCETEMEFQTSWDMMIKDFQLQDHGWLSNLYKIREKWCRALNRDVFFGGIKSSQRSESTNNVLSGISNKTTSLAKFVVAFENIVAGWRSSESDEDFRCKQGAPKRAIKKSGILYHAAQVYTVKIFKLFQIEFLNGVPYAWSEVACHGTHHVYEVVEEGNDPRLHTIHFDTSNEDIYCTCKKFEAMGILCSHALRVLSVKNVKHIPNQYILSRWTKMVKTRMIGFERGKQVQHDENDTEIVFRNRMMRFAYNFIMKSQRSEGTREICQKFLSMGDEEVEKEISRLSLGANANANVEENKAVGDDNQVDCSFDDVPLLNPPNVRPKGVSNARLKGHFEKRKTKATKEVDTYRKSKKSMTQASSKNSVHITHNPRSFHELFPTPNPMIYPIYGHSPNTLSTPLSVPSPNPSQNSLSTWGWGQFSNM